MNLLFHHQGKLAYVRKGVGKEVYLIFHGFGQTHRDMLALDQIRKPGQKFLFIDLFYHGGSQWASSARILTKSIWQELIEGLQVQEDFQGFHLIGRQARKGGRGNHFHQRGRHHCNLGRCQDRESIGRQHVQLQRAQCRHLLGRQA